MDPRTAAWDAMGTLFDISPVSERYGDATMPRLLHVALSLQAAGTFVPFPELVESLLGGEAVDVFAQLEPYEDAKPALEHLRGRDVRNVVLTNGSEKNTRHLLERGGLAHLFDDVLTVAQVGRYKPAPEPYGLVGRTAVLVAAHDWDVAGARAAGLRAVYVDRENAGWKLPGEEPERVRTLVAAAEAAAA